jgi:hypothetical protein
MYILAKWYENRNISNLYKNFYKYKDLYMQADTRKKQNK